MIDCYQRLFVELDQLGLTAWSRQLAEQVNNAFSEQSHGDLACWQKAVDDLPSITPSRIELVESVSIGVATDLRNEFRQQLINNLKKLHPWRKGPFHLFGLHIDTEWRSDWKWDRLRAQIAPLHKRLVLDVGCGNGYHCWRMLGAGARMVVGVDPTLLNVLQYQSVRKLHGGDAPVFVLPLGSEQLPSDMKLFDTVFSMGVLYHRRSPIDHLMDLKGCLRPGGELVLETLVVDGDMNTVLLPERRYAQMRNVWFLPSCEALMLWLRRCGYKNVRLCDVTKTTVLEQRSTEWMMFNSLRDFLDPADDELTCERLPAPKRAIVIANA
ncbi:tRNA 5-methoxyuridine(34)/uridine 5-oxyacetic acid(34) synthase CmoB [Methylomonas sp. MgM2]